jgi:hypothetical protein
MNSLQDRINNLFNKFNVNLKTEEVTEVEVKLEAEATLENGTVIYTDAENFEDGADVYILNEEGEKMPLPEGDYVLADGTVLTIAEGGKVSSTDSEGAVDDAKAGVDSRADGNPSKGGKKPVAAKPDAKKKKSAQDKLAEDEEEEEKGMEEKEKEEYMDEAMIVDLINRILDERFPTEEVVEEELAADTAVTELKAMLDSQAEELTTLKSQAASEGVKRATPTKAQPKVDLKSLSTDDRIKALFNKYNS